MSAGFALGFPIKQVRELVSLSQSKERDCFETLAIAQARLAAARAKMAELRTLERTLARFVRSCSDMAPVGQRFSAPSSRT